MPFPFCASLRSLQDVLNSLKLILRSIFKHVQNDKRVDKDTYKEITENVVPSTPPCLPEEKAFLNEMEKFLEKEGKWEYFPPEKEVYLRMARRHDTKDLWGLAEGHIHVAAKKIFSYLLCYDSKERLAKHMKTNGKLPRTMHVLDGTHTRFFFTTQKMPSPLHNRRYDIAVVWDAEIDETTGRWVYKIAFQPVQNYRGDPAKVKAAVEKSCLDKDNDKLVIGATSGIYIIKEVRWSKEERAGAKKKGMA